jgi:hypothetical protein
VAAAAADVLDRPHPWPTDIGLIFFFDNNVEEALKRQHLAVGGDSVEVDWGIAVLWLFMLGVYMLIPHTQVSWKPAMIGAGIAAVLLADWQGRTWLPISATP